MNPRTRDAALAWLANNPNSTRAQIAEGLGMKPSSIKNILLLLRSMNQIHISSYPPRAGRGRRHQAYSVGRSKSYRVKPPSISPLESNMIDYITRHPMVTPLELCDYVDADDIYSAIARLRAIGKIHIAGYSNEPTTKRRQMLLKAGKGKDAPYPKRPAAPAVPRKPRVVSRPARVIGNPFERMVAQLAA